MGSQCIYTKRVYLPPARADGRRVLVDRLWPRGLSKSAAQLDEWMRGVAPSTELRGWFNHQPERFMEFTERYRQELLVDEVRKSCVQQLRRYAEHSTLTLLYAAKDEVHNHAVVLLGVIQGKL